MSESILEKALLEAEQLEETMKSNAKEILSSTMKKEIHELVKESLNEDDYLKEQEEEEVDMIDLDDDMDDDEMEMDMETEMGDDMELDIEDETEDEELPELPPLDLTLASDEEVLKVFKAMGDEDGIIIQQDDDEIELTDTTNDTEYIIKLDEEKKSKTMKKAVNKTKQISEMKHMKEMDKMKEMDMDEMDMDEMAHMDEMHHETKEAYGMKKEMAHMDEMDMEEMHHAKEGYTKEAYMDEMEDMDEVVYEIELSEDEDMKEEELKHGTSDEKMKEGEMKERQKYGGNKGDESRSKRDYAEMEMKERQKYGGNKGDESRSRKDYSETEMKEGDYGFKHHKGHSDQGYLDREGDMLGGKHGHEDDKMSMKTRERMARGTRKYDMGEGSRTLGFGRESDGKHKPSGIRKAISPNRYLGESRLRKSYNLLKEEVETLKVKNNDYKKALTTFKDKLNEVGVFNSNLAYVTRLFTEHSTTKQEKINILKRFDNIDSLKSSKGLYKVIKEELTQEVAKPTKTISESVEDKITKSPTSGTGKLLESKVYENPQFSRMKDLMSKLK